MHRWSLPTTGMNIGNTGYVGAFMRESGSVYAYIPITSGSVYAWITSWGHRLIHSYSDTKPSMTYLTIRKTKKTPQGNSKISSMPPAFFRISESLYHDS